MRCAVRRYVGARCAMRDAWVHVARYVECGAWYLAVLCAVPTTQHVHHGYHDGWGSMAAEEEPIGVGVGSYPLVG